MYASVVTALALASTAVAAPTLQSRANQFRLQVTGNENLVAWKVINSHISAGTNVIQIQRPSAYISDASYFDGTALAFDLGTPIPYEFRMPQVPAGTVGQVSSQQGTGTAGFGLDADNLLTYESSARGFWACPVDGTFELFYGVDPEPANLPSTECQAIEFVALPIE